MDYVRLGHTDIKVSSVGIGTWQFGTEGWGYGRDFTREDAVEAVREAYNHGINFIDTAEAYGGGLSEKIVGEAVKDFRGEVVIATKVSPMHLHRRDIFKALRWSLRRLGTSYVDLYQVHWPYCYIPVREAMKAMRELVREGKIRAVGVSNFPVCLMEEAISALDDVPLASNQLKYNILQREIEAEIYPYMTERGITVIAYSPLAQGVLTGKYRPGAQPPDQVRRGNPLFKHENLKQAWKIVELLKELAMKYGVKPSQVALNWLICKKAVPIPGVKRPSHSADAAAASGWRLSESDIRKIDSLSSQLEISYYMGGGGD